MSDTRTAVVSRMQKHLRRVSMASIGLVCGWFFIAILVDWVGTKLPAPQVAPHQAVVVLGCGVRRDGNPSPSLRRRVLLGYRVYRELHADLLVLTGGVDEGQTESEARIASRFLRRTHPEAEGARIVLEERSTSTYENAAFAAEEIARTHRHVARVVVVTDAYHAARARSVFRRFFPEVRVVVGQPSFAVRIHGALREVIAWLAYLVLNRV